MLEVARGSESSLFVAHSRDSARWEIEAVRADPQAAHIRPL